ncbi:MAG: tetratricopeptide repeat protein [Mongoliibacter sp.]|uniref:tetratricopeptide repeat protein n=1 Tax=Mongoliibacter sp. TaxID=2022438 RepID=UPI0012F0858D|nr:tetratricopeptide repeat protein [Mongoliibacter sp.]TVP47112.1 MAG: tetratricopeptide repeat protein [Mongoliibacter sp.]
MFRNQRFNLLLLLFFALSVACSPKINKYDSVLDGISAKPEVLAMHRDSVRVDITGSLPLPLLDKNTIVYLYPEYRYGEGALRLGEFKVFDGVYDNITQAVRLEEKIKFPYLEGMERGELALKALVFYKDKVITPKEKSLAPGLDTSPLLTRLGQVIPNEPIQEIGIYIETDFSGYSSNIEREFTVNFPLASAQVPGRSIPAELYNFLSRGEKGYVIEKIKITGITSPEDAELGNPSLATERSNNLKTRIINIKGFTNFKVETDTRTNDWFDFRMLLRDYSGISADQKNEYYEILTSNNNFASKLNELRQKNTYRKVSSELFPRLRAAKVSVSLQNARFSDAEIAASVFKMLQEGEGLEGFTKEHLIYAGQEAKRLQEKERIYLKLTEIYPSVIAFNNLGVVYLNKAQRELDMREKNILINQSISMFREANRIQANSTSMHNLGRAFILRQDYFEAYVAISEASGLEKDESNSFLRYNEGIRGALDILNGDYRLATIRFNRAPENEVNYFNKGLAYFLAEDYKQALIAFEESVQVNREDGYGFYGLALVAAKSADEQALIENLEKAISRSEYLKERAINEVIFKDYLDTPRFMRVFK